MTRTPLVAPLLHLAAGCLLLALGGCGFALRGSVDLPPELRTLQVTSADDSGELLQQVRRALRSSGVTLDYRLGLGREVATERMVSVNSNARAGEYEVEMSLQFQLLKDGSAVLGPDVLSLTRVYLTDPENAVAKEEEAELIRTELRRELAQQLLRRLQVAPL